MADFKATLTKKIGPLPAFAWVILVGGGLTYVWWANRGRTAEPTISTGTDAATGEAAAPSQVGGFGTLTPLPPVVVPTTPVTNEEWVQAALEAMQLAQPFLDSAAAEDALRAHIAGNQLTAQQVAYVTLAYALIGKPPLPIPVKPGGGGINPPPPVSTISRPRQIPLLPIAKLNSRTVRVSWIKRIGVTSYEVQRVPGGSWRSVGNVSSWQETVTKSGIYAWNVRGRNAAGAGPVSRTMSVRLRVAA